VDVEQGYRIKATVWDLLGVVIRRRGNLSEGSLEGHCGLGNHVCGDSYLDSSRYNFFRRPKCSCYFGHDCRSRLIKMDFSLARSRDDCLGRMYAEKQGIEHVNTYVTIDQGFGVVGEVWGKGTSSKISVTLVWQIQVLAWYT
jgi:hypothetical protein